MCNEEEDKLYRIFEDIRDAVTSDSYEVGGIWTVGGPNGNYILKSPFNTECEVSFIAIFGTNQAAGSPGFMTISTSNPSNQGPAGLNAAYGSTVNGSEGNAFDGIIVPVSQTISLELPDVWIPLGRDAFVYFQVTQTTSGVYALVTFRRKLAHIIPDKPRQKPHTHSHAGSRGPVRRLAAQSTQVAGYESQYPEQGEKVPFTHGDARKVLSQGVDAVQQDTGVMRRGIFPLGPTNIKHRK